MKERFLVVVNKAQLNKSIQLPMEETTLAGCTEFHAVTPVAQTAPVVSGGNLHINEPAESMTVYEVR
jgi:hypothetical protein